MKTILSFETIFYFIVFILMATIYQLSFTWFIVPSLAFFIAIFCSFIFLSKRKLEYKNGSVIVLLGVFYIYNCFIEYGSIIKVLIVNILYFTMATCVIFLSLKDKYNLLKFVSRSTSIILLISIIGWILFLLQVPLPHTTGMCYDDGYHEYINYYSFLLVLKINEFELPRFTSIFKEPGQLASICVLLSLANIKIIKSKFDTIVLLVALFLTFSLAGWCVMFISVVILLLFEYKIKIKQIFIFLLFVTPVVYVGLLDEDSAIHYYIFNRLEYDEDGGIKGNNRTDYNFNKKYEKFASTSDFYVGVQKELATGYNWTHGCAGLRVYIVYYGLIGLILTILILYAYLKLYKSRMGFVFLFTYILLCSIRAYFMNPYWIYIYILAIPFFMDENKCIYVKTKME